MLMLFVLRQGLAHAHLEVSMEQRLALSSWFFCPDLCGAMTKPMDLYMPGKHTTNWVTSYSATPFLFGCGVLFCF